MIFASHRALAKGPRFDPGPKHFAQDGNFEGCAISPKAATRSPTLCTPQLPQLSKILRLCQRKLLLSGLHLGVMSTGFPVEGNFPIPTPPTGGTESGRLAKCVLAHSIDRFG
jgi:hypothetical protein